MSVVRTDEWLDESFDEPSKICRDLVPEQKDASNFYRYLVSFGLYEPNSIASKIFLGLKEEDTWNKVKSLFLRYKQKWNGPDIPIYIFPIHHKQIKAFNGKSGVSFRDKMFLFLSPLQDDKELEALFLHEYHHVCRMKHVNKLSTEYTLLDSIVLEGLAEWTVMRTLGKTYTAKWISRYSDEKLEYYWEKYFEQKCSIKRGDRLHDVLLFGKGMFPDLIGYAVGYWLVNKNYQKCAFSINESLRLPTNELIQYNE